MSKRLEASVVIFDGVCYLPTAFMEGNLRTLDLPYERLDEDDEVAVRQIRDRLLTPPVRRRASRALKLPGTSADPPFYVSDREYRRRAKHVSISWSDSEFKIVFVPQDPPYRTPELASGRADSAEAVAREAVRVLRRGVV